MVFNLRHNERFTFSFPQNAAQFHQVAGLAHKTQSHKVNRQFSAELHIGNVLFCKRRKIDPNARQIDVATRAEGSGSQDTTANSILPLLQDEQPDQAVVDQHGISDLNVIYESFVIYIDRIFLLALCSPDGELDRIAGV